MAFVPAWPLKTVEKCWLAAGHAADVDCRRKRLPHGSSLTHAWFPPSARLLRPEDYRRVFDTPAFKVSSAAFLLLAQHSDTSNSRVGIIVAKKHVRRAIRRNRIKRLIREQFRLNRPSPNLDLVVLARSAADTMDNAQITSELGRLWSDLQRKAIAK